MSRSETLINFIVIFCIALLMAVSLQQCVQRPVVQLAWPDEQCVRVLYADGFSCDRLPDTYTVQFVQILEGDSGNPPNAANTQE